MAQKRELPFEGKNIYYDKKNRSIYYNKRKQIGYVITPEKQSAFRNFSMRYILGVIVVIFIYYLLPNLPFYVSLLGGALSILFLEYRYRKLLHSCAQIPSFNVENSTPSQQIKAKNSSKSAIIVRSVALLLLGTLLIVNLFISKGLLDDPFIVITSCIVAFYAAYQAVMGIRKLNVKTS